MKIQKSRPSHFFSTQIIQKEWPLLLIPLCLYLPFINLGPGTDQDSWAALASGRRLFEQYYYQYSRPPGYFVHEFFTGLGYLIGGISFSNFLTLSLTLIAVFTYKKLLSLWKIPYPYLLSLIFLTQPYIWKSASLIIDYNWSLAFFLLGLYNKEKGNESLSFFFFPLAVGCRLSACLLIGVVYLVSGVEKIWPFHKNTSHIIQKFLPEMGKLSFLGFLSALLYIPSFIAADYSLDFLTYYIGDWSIFAYVARFVYKNIYLWGPLAAVMLLSSLCLVLFFPHTGFLTKLKKHPKFFLIFFLVLINELLFLKVPIEIEYLIPGIPFTLMLFSLIYDKSLQVIFIFFLLSFSHNLVTINTFTPDQKNNAKKASLDIHLRPGILISDIIERLQLKDKGL